MRTFLSKVGTPTLVLVALPLIVVTQPLGSFLFSANCPDGNYCYAKLQTSVGAETGAYCPDETNMAVALRPPSGEDRIIIDPRQCADGKVICTLTVKGRPYVSEDCLGQLSYRELQDGVCKDQSFLFTPGNYGLRTWESTCSCIEYGIHRGRVHIIWRSVSNDDGEGADCPCTPETIVFQRGYYCYCCS